MSQPYARTERETIIREPQSTGQDAATLALGALGWILADLSRADRLLALTGLTPDALRAGLDQPAMLRAVIDFLCSYEPDLVAAAAALGVEPAELASARKRL